MLILHELSVWLQALGFIVYEMHCSQYCICHYLVLCNSALQIPGPYVSLFFLHPYEKNVNNEGVESVCCASPV